MQIAAGMGLQFCMIFTVQSLNYRSLCLSRWLQVRLAPWLMSVLLHIAVLAAGGLWFASVAPAPASSEPPLLVTIPALPSIAGVLPAEPMAASHTKQTPIAPQTAPAIQPTAPVQAISLKPTALEPLSRPMAPPALTAPPLPSPASLSPALPSLALPASGSPASALATATPHMLQPAAPAQLPSRFIAARADAAYLNNPAPPYPAQSRRLGESGTVQLWVKVSDLGHVEAVSIHRSSGFDRLDQAARTAVLAWRFIPATRGGQAQADAVIVPVVFKD